MASPQKLTEYTLDELMAKRDRLDEALRYRHVPGLLSVGLTRRSGRAALLVAVREGSRPNVPSNFENVDVVVERFTDAVAQ
jgi:hypothetical protein